MVKYDQQFQRALAAAKGNGKGAIAVPYRLTWAGTSTGRFRDRKPGRGDAGWTIATFRTPKEAHQFLTSLPGVAFMPGTHRVQKSLERQLGNGGGSKRLSMPARKSSGMGEGDKVLKWAREAQQAALAGRCSEAARKHKAALNLFDKHGGMGFKEGEAVDDAGRAIKRLCKGSAKSGGRKRLSVETRGAKYQRAQATVRKGTKYKAAEKIIDQTTNLESGFGDRKKMSVLSRKLITNVRFGQSLWPDKKDSAATARTLGQIIDNLLNSTAMREQGHIKQALLYERTVSDHYSKLPMYARW